MHGMEKVDGRTAQQNIQLRQKKLLIYSMYDQLIELTTTGQDVETATGTDGFKREVDNFLVVRSINGSEP